MSLWLLYLMTRTEAMAGAMMIFCIGSVMTVVLGAFIVPMARDIGDISDETILAAKKWGKRLVIATVVCLVLSSLMPSKKDWYLIIGGYYVTHVQGIDKLPPNIVGAMNKFLEQYSEKPEKQGSGI